MTTISTSHSVGDANHTSDHNRLASGLALVTKNANYAMQPLDAIVLASGTSAITLPALTPPVTVDAVALGTGANTTSTSTTVTTAAANELIVVVAGYYGGGNSPTGVTVDGTAATLIVNNNTTGQAVYYYLAASAGAHTVTATYSVNVTAYYYVMAYALVAVDRTSVAAPVVMRSTSPATSISSPSFTTKSFALAVCGGAGSAAAANATTDSVGSTWTTDRTAALGSVENFSAAHASTTAGVSDVVTVTNAQGSFGFGCDLAVVTMNPDLTALAAIVGKRHTIKNIGTGTVTVTPPSGTIDGAANVTLSTQYSSVDIVTDGTNWFKV